MTILTQVCKKCKLPQALENFSRAPKCKSGYLGTCKACRNARRNELCAANPKVAREKQDRRKPYSREWQREFRRTPAGKVHVRNMNLKKYGLTARGYDDMLAAQGGVCASCRQPETGRNQHGPVPLAVDHDHETNAVRGLLCMRCNRALGMLGDSAETVEALATYRRRYS